MIRLRPGVRQRACIVLAVVILAASGDAARAAKDVLKVCQDPNNLPFTNERGEGFENRIAELFAQKLGWKLESFSFPQRMGFVRNTLRFKLPGEEYRCDLIIGVPKGSVVLQVPHHPPSSGLGMVYQRQSIAPSFASNAVTRPRMPYSAPLAPTITFPSAITGAIVML